MDLASLLSTAPKSYTPMDSSYYKRSAPPSPPAEEPKVSLPSISSLLERADSQHSAKRQRLSPPVGERHTWVQPYELPPTPPLHPGSGHGHSRASPELAEDHCSSISSNGSIHIAQPYASPATSVSSYTSPIDAPQQALYYSHPPTTSTFAPSTHAPAPLPVQQPLISPATPASQHHHYFPPSSKTQYQQNHDRYICRTCHKAFSRPSSLRIHSHSHTGEKPFRCAHAGCGKVFSVRSNMRRHEGGCHSGRPAPALVV